MLVAAVFTVSGSGAGDREAWNPVRGDRYVNPVINADYSDPDVCRVGGDYYMTASSFNCMPGLQILHSTDLVNWEIVGAALESYPADDWGGSVQHGNGVWAPAIRHHDGEFYIYWGDPDRGIFMVKSSSAEGPWEKPVKVVDAKGFIDPCPLWDKDGKAYLSHGCAGSRAALKSVLMVAPMSADGKSLTGPSRIVYDGHLTQPTIEGTKLYRRNGYYYIFSPAGGVATGWQTVLRSKSVFGPYEEKVVMAQGDSDVNGPHQGAWVETQTGEHWFLHFQDKGAYGRVVHLQPMRWVDDWPVIGVDDDGDGVGEPVAEYSMPDLPSCGEFQPSASDEFDSGSLGLQWQWPAEPSPFWYHMDQKKGCLRLYSAVQPEGASNLADCPNLLLQKFLAEDFSMTAKVSFVPDPRLDGETAGLVVMGLDYAALVLTDTGDGVVLQYAECRDALSGAGEIRSEAVEIPLRNCAEPYSAVYMSTTVPPAYFPEYASADIYLKVEVSRKEVPGNHDAAICAFSYSLDGKHFTRIGKEFEASAGKWIGAKAGVFCNRSVWKNDGGWLDVDWFRVGR